MYQTGVHNFSSINTSKASVPLGFMRVLKFLQCFLNAIWDSTLTSGQRNMAYIEETHITPVE